MESARAHVPIMWRIPLNWPKTQTVWWTSVHIVSSECLFVRKQSLFYLIQRD